MQAVAAFSKKERSVCQPLKLGTSSQKRPTADVSMQRKKDAAEKETVFRREKNAKTNVWVGIRVTFISNDNKTYFEKEFSHLMCSSSRLRSIIAVTVKKSNNFRMLKYLGIRICIKLLKLIA